jgi:hypothetical protein
MESVMEEEDIEECIKKVNAIDNGIQLFIQNTSQKFENLRNLKKKYVDKLVDYKVFIGDCDDKKEKEKKFKEVENLSREFKMSVKNLIEYDAGTKKFIETIDKENEALTNQINSYKNTLKDIEKYIKNNPVKTKKIEPKKEKEEPKKEETKKEETKKEEPKKEEPKKEEPKKEEPKKEEPKKEEPKKEEPKKEETKKEQPKKEETKKEETKKEETKKGEEPIKAGPKRETEVPKSDVRFMSNTPLYLGSILPDESSCISNNPERKEEILIGFKSGSCALGQLNNNQLAVSPEFDLEMGQILSIHVCESKLCKGVYLVCGKKKKSVAIVYPTVENDKLSFNRTLLTRMEDDNPSLVDAGGESQVILTEFRKSDLCAYCKNHIFLWQELAGKFNLSKISLDHDITNLIQVGDNNILALLLTKGKFVLIDLTNHDKKVLDIGIEFKLSLRDDSSLIQISNKYFVIDNGIKYDMFEYDQNLKYLKSFQKNPSHVESYKKINENTYILCEFFNGKRFFTKYKFEIKEGEPKFEVCGGPYMFDVASRLQSYCVLGDELLVVVEKGSKKIYIFKI